MQQLAQHLLLLRAGGGLQGLLRAQAAVAEGLAAGCRALATAADPAAAGGAGGEASTSGQQPRVYAAVVLERLPVVRPEPPEWEAEYKAWAEQRRLAAGFYKEYPSTGKKASRAKDDEAHAFQPVPVETPADRSGDTSTMKRRLREKLVLLVRQKEGVLNTGGGGGAGKGKGGGGKGGGGAWAFPHVEHKEGETVRAAAERALREAVGTAEVFFIGNAPMAHLPLGGGGASSGSGQASSSSSGGGGGGGGITPRALHTSASAEAAAGGGGGDVTTTSGGGGGDAVFFMLAQAVNDPWDVQLRGSFAAGHAWVAPGELGDYISDGRLLELARKML